VRTKIVSIKNLSAPQITQMFHLMDQYYYQMSEQTFQSDLFEKQKVILLLGEDGGIKGFSTIVQSELRVDGKLFIALYSGDTVLQKEYWGNGALAMAFGRYLLQVKLRHPLRPVFWFLISKGYRTYLLMTNNFPEHYPRFEKMTPPPLQNVMNCFYSQRFGQSFRSQEGLIQVAQSKASGLREYIAEITEELRRRPRIAFFEKRNPNWRDGVELACMAKVTLWIPFRYVMKRVLKLLWRERTTVSEELQGVSSRTF
jgi:hypothetical protein